MFKSIFIANLAEVARPLIKLMEADKAEAEIWEDHYLSGRSLFSDSDNRLLITPFPIDRQFFQDSCQLLGFKNIVNLSPKKVGGQELREMIIETIRENSGISLISYAATKEFADLVSCLRLKKLDFQTPEIPDEKNFWVVDFFDSKSGFRQTVPFLGQNFPPMPRGAICANIKEAVGWASYLVENTAGCVIKVNRGLAGAGLRIVKKEEVKSEDLRKFVEKIIKSEGYWQNEVFVVEEFIEPDLSVAGGAPNIELKIDQSGVHPLYVCGMRITPEGVFRGVEIGRGAMPEKMGKKLTAYGLQLGKYLEKFGYLGYFEIDFVFGKKGLFPIEANLRRTGGTHVYELGKRLLGDNFIDNYYVVANNIVEAPRFKGKSYQFVKEALKPLLYPIKGKKEGVILTIISLSGKVQLGYAVIGADKNKTLKIETEFLVEC